MPGDIDEPEGINPAAIRIPEETVDKESTVPAQVNEVSRKSMPILPRELGQFDDHVCTYVFKEGRLARGLKAKHLRFLNAIKDSKSIEEACRRSGLTVDDFVGLCQRKEFRDLVEDRFKEVAVRKGITAEWLASEAVQVWEGSKKKDFQQMIVWKELMARVWPREKVGGGSNEGGKVQININVDRMAEAKERQKVIEAEAETPDS